MSMYEVPLTEVFVFKNEGLIIGGTTETPGEVPGLLIKETTGGNTFGRSCYK